MMQKTVAILRGGYDPEHDVSLQTGAAVLSQLRGALADTYRTVDIFIDRNGAWHSRGVPASPEKALRGIDVVWNALHGPYGEDGKVQRLLDRIGVPYTGSGSYASALAMNKALTKEILAKAGVRTPRGILLSVSPTLEDDIRAAFRTFPLPSVIKPVSSGSSVGVTIARSYQEFAKGVRDAFQHAGRVMVEEYLEGREATVGVVDAFRGTPRYALPLIEIVPGGGGFYDYNAKYNDATTVLHCPGNFSIQECDSLREAAFLAHEALGLRHYSRSDFIVSKRGVYFLEVNTLPGLTAYSNFPRALEAVGASLKEFIEHVLNLALTAK